MRVQGQAQEANPTMASRIDRRTILKGAAAGVAATTLGTVSKRSTFAAPAFLQGTTIVFAVHDRRRATRSSRSSMTTRRRTTSRSRSSRARTPTSRPKMITNLTQGTGAYDVVSMDDPWMPQFAGGEFIMNLGELMDERGIESDPDFVPELLALGDFPPGSGLRGIPWVGNVQVFAWRTDVLEELGLEAPPATWDEVLAYAQAITEAKSAEGLYGIGMRGEPGNPAATSFLPVLRGYGTDLFDENWEPQLETDAAMQAITTQLALAKLAPPGVETVGHAENGQQHEPGSHRPVGGHLARPAPADLRSRAFQGGWEGRHRWRAGAGGRRAGQHDRQLAARHPGGKPERRRRARLHPLVHGAGAAEAPAARTEHSGDPDQRHGGPGGGREAAIPAGIAGGRAQRGAASADRALQRGGGDLRPLRRRGDRRPDHAARKP